MPNLVDVGQTVWA